MLACLLLAAGAARRGAVLTAAKAQPPTQLLFHERLIAGAGLYVAGVAASVKEGCELASAAMKAGTPLALMEKWAACSQQE